MSVNERRSSRTRAGGGGRNTRNTYTNTGAGFVLRIRYTYYNIHVSSCVRIIISGIIHAGNEVFCNTRGGGDRRRSYYIGWYLVYTYADLWALVVPSSLSRLIEYTCTCSSRATTTTTTRKQTATGSFFPTSSTGRAASRPARRSIRMCP